MAGGFPGAESRPLFVSWRGWYDGAMRTAPFLLALICLSACGKQDNAPGPGGVSVGEAKALDEAAEMLEGQRVPVAPAPSPSAPPAKPR